jgi:ABC-type dipeptide/oligopeptide/nickel transport system permease subunit
MFFGLLFGMIAGYYRGRIEAVITTGFDVLLAIPGLVLLLPFSTLFAGSILTVSLSLGFLFIPAFAHRPCHYPEFCRTGICIGGPRQRRQ